MLDFRLHSSLHDKHSRNGTRDATSCHDLNRYKNSFIDYTLENGLMSFVEDIHE